MDQKTKDLLESGRKMPLEGYMLGIAGVDSKEPRPFVCARCGLPFEDGKAYHYKPENYRFEYDGVIYYLERHLHKHCYEEEWKERD